MGATATPILAGALAQRHGLAVTRWLAAAGSGLLFLGTLFLQETRPAPPLATTPSMGARLQEQPESEE
jgi:hypothetical protein